MHITKLLTISSSSTAKVDIAAESLAGLRSRGGLFVELADLLPQRNGFYASESALHVFPVVKSPLLASAYCPKFLLFLVGSSMRRIYLRSMQKKGCAIEVSCGVNCAISQMEHKCA
jgi:hypothetical protein